MLPSTAGDPNKVTVQGKIINASSTKLMPQNIPSPMSKPIPPKVCCPRPMPRPMPIIPQWAENYIKTHPNMMYYNGRVIPSVAAYRDAAEKRRIDAINNPKPIKKDIIGSARW